MAVSDYSTTPADNTSISGLTVTDATLADALDNIIRQMMADTRAAYDATPRLADSATVSGDWTVSGNWEFTGEPTFSAPATFSDTLDITGAATFTDAVDLSGATVTLAPNMAPTPAATDIPGYWRPISSALGGALVLDAGGTWAYSAVRYNSGVASNGASGVAAGGSTVGPAASGQNWTGFAWRVQE